MSNNPHEKLANNLYIGSLIFFPIFFIVVSVIGTQKNSIEIISVPIEKLKKYCVNGKCFIEAKIQDKNTSKKITLPNFQELKVGDFIYVEKTCNEFSTKKPCKYRFKR